MTATFDPVTRIGILRADRYPDVEDWSDRSTLVEPLGSDYLAVDADVARSGRVILGSGASDPDADGRGVEFDLEPAAARLLARQLELAADTSERRG